MKIKEIAREYKDIRRDYVWNPSIFTLDDAKVRRIKYIIDTKLSQADRIIILLYAELGSYRKLGERLNLSHMTIRRECVRIRNIILDEYNRTSTK